MTVKVDGHVYVPQAGARVRGSVLNLVNLLLRETAHRITVVQIDAKLEADPELFVVTRLDWRNSDFSVPILLQLPRVLSILETLRGMKAVPSQVYLDSAEGIAAYLPTMKRLSDIPEAGKAAVDFLLDLVESTVNYCVTTIKDVEQYFWRAARQRGFSPAIVESITRREQGFSEHEEEFYSVLHRFFSIRFTIYTAESVIHVEV